MHLNKLNAFSLTFSTSSRRTVPQCKSWAKAMFYQHNYIGSKCDTEGRNLQAMNNVVITLWKNLNNPDQMSAKDLAGCTHSKVNEVQLAHAHMHVPIYSLLTALNGDSEDGMRARAVLIHVCGTNRTF